MLWAEALDELFKKGVAFFLVSIECLAKVLVFREQLGVDGLKELKSFEHALKLLFVLESVASGVLISRAQQFDFHFELMDMAVLLTQELGFCLELLDAFHTGINNPDTLVEIGYSSGVRRS